MVLVFYFENISKIRIDLNGGRGGLNQALGFRSKGNANSVMKTIPMILIDDSRELSSTAPLFGETRAS